MSSHDDPTDPDLPYMVVTADSSRELSLCVSAALGRGRGWKLSGGVAVTCYYESESDCRGPNDFPGPTYIFAQAMVRP